MQTGYLGIDAGTQGLSVVFTNESMQVLATGDGSYEMLAGLPEGCYEQNPADWLAALSQAMNDLRTKLAGDIQILAIGISGQMHGEVLSDATGNPVGPVRLWCDGRNADEESELTEQFNVKMPKRMTAVRWLWTTRNQKEKAALAKNLTTPAGWLAFQLTGQWNLGIGDAAGMFPVDQQTLDFDQDLLKKFQDIAGTDFLSLTQLLPNVRTAGQDAGQLSESGSQHLGLPPGIPVAAAEGDQPAALAGSLIGDAGMVSCSFGTSVCANSVGDRSFQGVDKAVDHFCAVDGKPINMVWLRNGTTFMNAIVEMFGAALGEDRSAGFDAVIPQVIAASADCGGVLALPFMDDEPGLNVQRGGTAMLVGLNPENSTPGNAVKAALLSTMFNLRRGSEVLDRQGFPRTELVLSGGLTKSPELAQILADVFRTPVTLLSSAAEGTAWGAALLAKFRHQKIAGDSKEWGTFLDQHRSESRPLTPNPQAADTYDQVYARYLRLLQSHPHFDEALADGHPAQL